MKKENRTRKHRQRKDLIGEHVWGDTGQIILLLSFMTVWILDSFIFNWSTFPAQYVSNYIRIPLGAILLIISGYLAKNGLHIIFGEVRDKPTVVRKGVFSVVRHPIYLASILVYLAMIVFSLSLLSIAMWLVIIIFYHLISRYEERLLLTELGADYRDYMKQVPMWIPRIKPK
ncbi:isoprenylcysteine carboxylmethyltransferase family protein [bacterium]|nr:isoprenylcysteine carboxylmethyltransferase family protein [bacterium]